MDWLAFLEAVAIECALSPDQKRAFLARFDRENAGKTEKWIAHQVKDKRGDLVFAGEAAYKKLMTAVYKAFQVSLFSELAHVAKGKRERLEALLKAEFERRSGATQPKANPMPDAPLDYAWVQRQLEAVSKHPSKKSANQDFFEGLEATWKDILAGHDVVRDVQEPILRSADEWRENSDAMEMVLIQGRSGDGKSTVLRRVAVELVQQGYDVLWYRGCESLQSKELERLAEKVENLVICVDDVAKLMPEEIERTLRFLKGSSVHIFWVATVREDLWSAMNLPLQHVVNLHQVSVRRLSDGEIDRLLDRLGEHDALGTLKGLSRDRQIAKLKDNADRQLLVALLEAKYNQRLGDYVRRNLNELEQKFGKGVADACYLTCAVQRFGLEIPIAHFQEILGILSPHKDIFSKTEGFLYPPSAMTGHPGVHVRHSVIATVAFEQDSAAYERLERFVEADLKLQKNGWNQTLGLCHNIRLQMRSSLFDLNQVRQIFERSAEDERSQKYILNIWAILERDAGNLEKARELFKQGSMADPKHAPIWQAWAILERDAGNLEKARELFKQATIVNPNSQSYRSSWSTFEEQQNQPQYLRAFHQCMAELFPNNVLSWQAWATFERTQGDPQRTRELYEKATQISPQNIPSWQAWAILEKELGNYPKAQELFQIAADIDPSRSEIWQAWAMMEKELEHYEKARQLFKKATEANPRQSSTWQPWAILELEGHNLDLALKFAEKAVQCQPKGIYPKLARGQVYLAIGRSDQGQKDLLDVRNKLQKRLANNPNNNRDLNLLARTFTLLQDYQQAETPYTDRSKSPALSNSPTRTTDSVNSIKFKGKPQKQSKHGKKRSHTLPIIFLQSTI